MESDFQQHPHVFLNSGHEPQRHHLHHHQHHQQQMSSGLTRFRSAPSSFFANLLDRDFCEEFLNRPSSPETERLLARLISGNRDDSSAQNHDSFQPSSPPQNEANYHRQSQFVAEPVKSEVDVIPQLQQTQQQNNYSSGSHYQNPSPQPPLPSRNMSYGVVRSSGTDRLPPMKAGGSNSNLIRQSSSPAGLFANINIDSGLQMAGYVSMEGMGNLIGGNGANAEASFSTANRLSNNNMNYSSRPAASMGHMSPIAELGEKPMRRASIQEGAAFGEGHGNNYVTSYPMSSWDDSTGVSESFNVLKRGRDEDGKTYSALEHANEEVRERPPLGLAHHLSLPKASDISAVEKFLQLQDSVPCKIRAKRGCATHPRSIAERVRRTKISERMRRLQDLVPNMDKQTNTADMLDLAVDYIKDLQKQVKDLSATRARCTCSRMQQL